MINATLVHIVREIHITPTDREFTINYKKIRVGHPKARPLPAPQQH